MGKRSNYFRIFPILIIVALLSSLFMVMPTLGTENVGHLRPDWVVQSSCTTANLYDVDAPSEQVAWAVGDGGTIVHTTNGGVNWYTQTSGTTMSLTKISAPSTNVAWALWNIPDHVNANLGVELQGLIRTTNGGNNWYRVTTLPTSENYSYSSISSPTDEVAWVTATNNLGNWQAKPLVFHTTNSGDSWYDENIATTENKGGLSDIVAVAPEIAWAAGDIYSVGIWHTTNAGLIWYNESNINVGGYGCYGVSITASSPTRAYLVGQDSKYGFNSIYLTTNSGENWKSSLSNFNRDAIPDISAPSDSYIWVVSGYNIYCSTNGGDSWYYSIATPYLDSSLSAISAPSNSVAYAVGGNGAIYKYIPSELKEKEINRLAGNDRYQTAVEICKAGWSSADTVILARGDDFADGLTATSLSYRMNAPLLLTEPKSLPASISEELKRLKAKKVIIIGSEDAIYPSVIEEIKSEANVNSFERIGGETRYDTSALISEKFVSGSVGSSSFIMTTGVDFPDALSAASVSAARQIPILLVRGDRGVVPSSVRNILLKNAISVSIIGGTDVVLPDTTDNWWFKEQGIFSERLSGDTRYDTCKAVADWATKDKAMCTDRIFIAYGENFPDALALGTVAGRVGAPLLLVRDKFIPSSIKDFLTSHKDEIKQVYIAGGEDVVSKDVENEIKQIIEIQ